MKLKPLAAALALAAAGLSSAQAAPMLSILPAQSNVAVNGFITVDIVISGLTGINEIVSGFDLNVSYDTSLLRWSVIDLDPGLNVMGGVGNALFGFDGDDSDGKIGGDVTSFLEDDDLDALQGDSFTLMSISFQGIAQGVSFLNFGTDPDLERLVTGRLLQSGIAGVLDLEYRGACIAVGDVNCPGQVPEPATYGLAGLALLGCGIATTRRRRSDGQVATA
ncbi:MAG: PEP-CTERM sorting domain-containing protein [Rubrivivax sp.]|nr:PEP-CTERM sorting domain-containing protein [Rubrivivax sp.]